MQIGLASTTGTEGKTTDLDKQQQTGQQQGFEDKLDAEPTMDTGVMEVELDQDTLEDESVSKYNFIFYFLYKFKYDHEESI